MAIFVIKGKKGAGTITREAETLIIGTKFSCGLSLEDPLVAPEHCAIHSTSDGFEIEDLGTVTGTYLNGTAVAGRIAIPTGEEIVLGVSRLKAEIELAKKQLTLTLREKEFYYDKKEDPLSWVRSEVSFGRFPPVRIANLLITAALLVILPLSFFGKTSENLANPGALCLAHQKALQNSSFAASAQNCEACHDPFANVPSDKCAQCHSDLMKNHHPFDRWEKSDCLRCHSEHQGIAANAVFTREAKSTCLDCHTEKLATRPLPAPSTQESSLLFNTFSHREHVKIQGIACSDCHLSDANTETQDFAPIRFESCMNCHGSDAKSQKRSKKIFTANWHGTDQGKENCLQCHQDLHANDLRTKEVVRADLSFSFQSRSHLEQSKLHPMGASDACVDCHRDQQFEKKREISSGFRHETHLSRVMPNETITAKALSSECLDCHREQRESRSLSSPSYAGASGDCKQCHETAMQSEQIANVKSASLKRSDFPHQFHIASTHPSLAQGCFSCHQFESDSQQQIPITFEKAGSCLPCHEGHRNIAGNSCQECHREGDRVYSNEALVKTRPMSPNFSHRSLGHRDLTDQGNCTACHDANTSNAQSLAEISIPSESQQACRDCHVAQKARFHWR